MLNPGPGSSSAAEIFAVVRAVNCDSSVVQAKRIESASRML
jgi:hypothetical protein